jgi:hypothetical protein
MPVLLPCGYSVCQKHVQGSQYYCTRCGICHLIPRQGFPQNRAVVELLLHANDNFQNDIQRQDYNNSATFESFRRLEETFEEMRLLHSEPSYFLNQTIGQLKRDANLIREEFKLKIDERADKIIGELDEYEQECSRALNVHQVQQKLEQMVIEMAELRRNMGSFVSSETEWKDLKSQAEIKNATLQDKLAEYKHEALLLKLNEYQTKIVSFSTIKLHSDHK